MGAIRRGLAIWLSIPLILLGVVFGGWSAVRYRYKRARTEWKTATLMQLSGLSLTSAEFSHELETLKASRGEGGRMDWTGEHVLWMTNNEYVVYASRHGVNDGFIDHLFIARGSDGRWYYSTYHFCNSMVMVRGDEPPGSIAEFVRKYSVREFDGRSDECLRRTWPTRE